MNVSSAQESVDGNVDLLMNIPVELTAELGRCKMRLADLLQLGNGSLIELETAAGAPVDLLANGKAIARGEIVAVGEHFGLHVTQVLNS